MSKNRTHTDYRIGLLALSIAALSNSTFATDETVDPAKFDKDNNGQISAIELRSIILPNFSDEYRDRDQNHDGYLDWVTLPSGGRHEDFLKAVEGVESLDPCAYFLETSAGHELDAAYGSVCDEHGGLAEIAEIKKRVPMTYSEVTAYLAEQTAKNGKPPILKNIHLRKNFETPVKKLEKSESATISFTDNREASNQIISLSGALFYGKDLEPSIVDGTVKQGLYGGVQFNRVDSDNEKGDINTLAFKVGSQWSWITLNENCDPAVTSTCSMEHSFTVDIAKNTDFDFDRNINTLSASYSPVFSRYTGIPKEVFSLFQVMLDVNTSLAISDVSDPGDSQDIESNRSYRYWGYQSSLTFFPPLTTSGANLKVTHDWVKELNDDYEDLEQTKVSLHLPIANNENLAVVVSYSKGENAITRESSDITEIGLGIKF
ncbi:hypothetical protein [uncultured Microbulbifer sp.]|uniref:hypothetical protein n=1 Tax=uncultured Microbulbifer sp. TaxID=348147 RepID=UPI00261E420B|nr:hypothetical protein [uncultured Microbulbifer sp.]